MLHLIRLELKKGRFINHIWGSLLAYGIILGFFLLIFLVDGNNQIDPAFLNHSEMLHVIDLIVRATFIIYASALISKLIITEFKDKTMAQLFTYPVSRKKLIFAKLTMVFVWTFVNVIIANLLIAAVLVAINSQLGYLTDPLTLEMKLQHGSFVLMQAFGAAGMSLLPLAVGIRKKSITATIISSIFIVMLVCSNNMGFTLSNIVAVPVSLAVLGIVITYLSFRKIDQVDIV